jgi:ABC-2 type transport system ATP-binding protein
VLDRLSAAGIASDGVAVSVHTPNLDDVFFALTGHPQTQSPVTQKGDVR